MILAAGTKLGPYEILSPLGAGGMGEVYLAQDTKLERTVALKIKEVILSATLGCRTLLEIRGVSRDYLPAALSLHPHIRDL